ncbi:preprotein translocase subunit YajC [Pengzhenrongella sicca]|uniref:preprotein translocase subunit YajC n=1 Tax=Pengzhenrongella sicca TaxID=2819238 RepID=UPI001D0CBF8D|nr:preprotein translocase subunit YajC [Pengzhenrongella sicca]
MEMIIIIALAFGAMWLMTNRTRKQQRAAGDFRANLDIGNEVMTGSGLYGTIVAIDGDTITLESTPGNESRWIRAAISKLVEPPVEDEADDDVEGDDELDDDEYETDEYEADEDEVDEFDAEDIDAEELDAAEADEDVIEADAIEADATVADDDVIEVPDDLSSLPPTSTDDDTDKK